MLLLFFFVTVVCEFVLKIFIRFILRQSLFPNKLGFFFVDFDSSHTDKLFLPNIFLTE